MELLCFGALFGMLVTMVIILTMNLITNREEEVQDTRDLEAAAAVLKLIKMDFRSMLSSGELRYLQVAIDYITEGIEKEDDGN